MKKCILMEVFNNQKNMLDELFYAREDELADIESDIQKELEKENINILKKYDELIMLFNNYSDNNVLNKFNNYLEEKNYANSLENEKYYKEGIKDGICLILECINRNENWVSY